ncbi:MAG: hypothetical protein JSS74_03440 [Actinobacteria bacterium]|nr:hypothetical protein [Actinomycetota bacterium]
MNDIDSGVQQAADKGLRICITSGGDEIRNRSYVNHAIYAGEHGFNHQLGIGLAQGITSQYYYKLEIVLATLPFFDWIVWLDDDVYVTDMRGRQIETLVAEAERHDQFLVIAEGPEEPDGTWTRVNTGVFVLRNDPRSYKLIERAKSVDLKELSERWDSERSGLWTNGDQDAIWDAIDSDEDLTRGTQIVAHSLLNSRPHYYRAGPEDAFAVHFCGPGDKAMKTAAFGRRFGLGQEIVAEDLLNRWSVRKRQSMPLVEILARRLRWRIRLGTKRVRRKVEWIRSTHRWK